MLLTSLQTTETSFRKFTSVSSKQGPELILPTRSRTLPGAPLLGASQPEAANSILGKSALLRTNLAAYLAPHTVGTRLQAPHARTCKAQHATAIEAVRKAVSRSLLEAKTQKLLARQGSASYVERNHVESAKLADLCKWRDT